MSITCIFSIQVLILLLFIIAIVRRLQQQQISLSNLQYYFSITGFILKNKIPDWPGFSGNPIVPRGWYYLDKQSSSQALSFPAVLGLGVVVNA